MNDYSLLKHIIRNGYMEWKLTQEYEKLRACVLDRDADGEDPATALRWFSYYGRKLARIQERMKR